MFTNILIAVDGSPCGNRAAQVGLEFAGQLNAWVSFTHAVGNGNNDERAQTAKALGQTLLEHWEHVAHEANLEVNSHLQTGASVAEAIIQASEFQGANLIVMGTQGREGIPRLLLGSVAERVLRESQLPVMLIRVGKQEGDKTPQFKNILVAVDGSKPSQLALGQAKELAHDLGAALEIFHVIPDVPAQYMTGFEYGAFIDIDRYQKDIELEGKAIMDGILAQLKADPAAPAKFVTTQIKAQGERPSDVIVRVAKEHQADLIVMGTHGYRGFDRLLLGSVAERVAHRAETPVLLMRALEVKTEQPAVAVSSQKVMASQP